MKVRSIMVSGAAVLALGAAAAFAQYPAPGGNITTRVGTSNPPTGSTTSVTVTVADSAGAPAPGVECTASIGSQPGSGASIAPTAFTTTDSGEGVLTLTTGDTAGPVSVSVACGQLSATASISVGALAPGFVPGPPNTGSGQPGADAGLPVPMVAGLVLLACAAASLTGLRVHRSRH